MDDTKDSIYQWSISDFYFGRIIGKGFVGTVYHGRLKHPYPGTFVTQQEQQDAVAIKVMDKHEIMRKKQLIEMVLTERKVLSYLAPSEFVVRLYVSFVDAQNLYLVMELCTCNLEALVLKHTTRNFVELPPSDRHYSFQRLDILSLQIILGQILMALEYIHSRSIVHCDLKPANILMNYRGRIKFTDFATAIFMNDIVSNWDDSNVQSFMGTADYVAPEILLADHSQERDRTKKARDLWALGCLVHFMFLGYSPFHSDCDHGTFNKIVGYSQDMDRARFWSNACLPFMVTDLVSNLLSVNPSDRLGMADEIDTTGNQCYRAIRSHCFFSDFNWDSLLHFNTDTVPTALMKRLQDLIVVTEEQMSDGISLPFDFFS